MRNELTFLFVERVEDVLAAMIPGLEARVAVAA